jgi:rhodanese-related sulfurtransferase
MNINVKDLKNRLVARNSKKDDFVLLDVRNPNEQEICIIPGTDLLIPVGELDYRMAELESYKNSEREIIVYCRSGGRSTNALNKLKSAGFQNLKNLEGGILAYADQIDPSMPKY